MREGKGLERVSVETADVSLVGVLRRRGHEVPDRVAFTLLAEGEVEIDSLTYRALEERARCLAVELRRRLRPGDRALLLYPSSLDFIIAFLACLSAGVVAVPVQAPRPQERSLARFRAIAKDAAPRAVLSTRALIGEGGIPRAHLAVPELEDALWWATDDGGAAGGDAPELPEPSPEDVAFLQYTSGSTSQPKGVVISHGNLLHNERMLGAAFLQDEASLVVGWLPLFHDMGLIGQVLQPLHAGGRCVLMAPAAFLHRPARWLEAISRYRATTSGGPNFAYDLCASKIPREALAELDLSSWKVAFSGAEPVRAATLERFAEMFGPCGFRAASFQPCYGLAEATLFVTGGTSGRGAKSLCADPAALERHELALAAGPGRVLVSCGRAGSGQRVAVVDPGTCTECPEGAIGEIWLAGPSVARGYWRQPEATESVFRAVLRTRAGEATERFLRTGDLGFLRDGELYVTGRLKDLIILRGRNHYPQDLELTAGESHPDLRPGGGAAFSVDAEAGERLVIVHEVERHSRERPEVIGAAVRQAVAQEHEIQVYEVVLIRTGSLLRTTSGKVQRRACRTSYLAGSLAIVGCSALADGEAGTAMPAPAPGVLAALDPLDRRDLLVPFLRNRAAVALGVASGEVSLVQPLTGLGLDSLSALQLKGNLEADLGVPVPFEELLAGLGIEELAERLAARFEACAGAVAEPEEGVESTPSDSTPQPLSAGQMGLWWIDRRMPAEAALNLAAAARAQGLDPAAFERALVRVRARHEALRTGFAGSGDTLVQLGLEDAVPDFRVEAAEGWSDEYLARRLDAEAWSPFDLERGPLWRVRLFARGEGEAVLLWAIHHLVADFWSLGLLARELGTLYSEETGGPAAALPPVEAAPRPADHSRWLARRLAGPRSEHLWSYWRQRLAGLLDLDLPTDRPRSPIQTWRGHAAFGQFSLAVSARLQEVARARSATPFMTILAAFQAQLGRYSGQEAFAVGSPVAGRSRPEVAGLVGYLVNPLPLGADLAGSPSFLDLQDRVRETVVGALEHGELPFPWMAERLGGARDVARPPLFQAQLVFHRGRPGDDPGFSAFALGDEGSRITLGGAVLESVRLRSRRVQVEIALGAALDAEGRLRFALELNSDLFEEVTTERLLGHFMVLFAGALETPKAPLWHLPLLRPAEREQLLEDWGSGGPGPPRGRCLHELFERQVDRTPEAVAVVAGDGRFTYGELDRRSNRLARLLRRWGAAPESRVGVCTFRSERLVEGVLGVLKAGAGYVPLDPTYPRDRIEHILADSGASLLVTEAGVEAALPFLAATEPRRVCLDTDRERLTAESDRRPAVAVDPGHLAYLIYTSGSTGRPKAVAIEHRGPVARVGWAGESFGPEEWGGVLASTSLCFDLSVFEIFVPLAYGGRIIMAADALSWSSLPGSGEVSLVNTVPSAMAALMREPLPPSVQTINLAGEPIPPLLARAILQLQPARRLWNLYGPSEDTTYSTGVRLTAEGGIPIGPPLTGTRLRLLDGRGEMVPAGVPGEIYLGGVGLARGYRGRPDLTAERFVPDSFGREPGARLYRTGDLARYRSGGELEYLGRLDLQVKIRGFRVELGEIEAALREIPGIREVVVADRADPTSGSRVLVAWWVPATSDEILTSEVRERLLLKLPGPMVPTAFMRLAALPLLPSGKVDRRALPEPQANIGGAMASAGPRGLVEELLAGIWTDLLGVPQVGRKDRFFDLGGHSLLASRLVSRVRDILNVELPYRAVFETPTLAGLAAVVESARLGGGSEPLPRLRRMPRSGPLPLSFAQERLWFVDRLEPGLATYNMAAAFEATGGLDRTALASGLAGMVWRHETLRTTFPMLGGRPVQSVSETTVPCLPLVDLGGLPATVGRRAAARLAREEALRPFDLGRGPLFRATLLRLASKVHRILITLHHITADGGSVGVLMRETAALYEAALAGSVSPLPELPIQYADYALWQREWLVDEVVEPQLAYWREALRELSALELPTDRPRPMKPSHRGGLERSVLPGDLAAALVRLGRSHGVTPFMILLAGFASLLSRYAGQDDVAVGVPVANRARLETEGLIGFFVNTLVLRLNLAASPSFDELLGRVRETTLGAYVHQDLPFDRLVEELRPDRTLAHTPFFQVFFSMENLPADELRLTGLELVPLESVGEIAKFDLTLALAATEARFKSTLSYSRDLFDATTGARLLAHFHTLLLAAVTDPGRRVGELLLLTPPERHQVLREWSGDQREYPGSELLHELVAVEAARTPAAPAVWCAGEWMSYGQLVARAGSLAYRLGAMGVGPENLVGVCLSRSFDLVAGVLGILQAGAAFLPLDPKLPAERLAYLIEDARATALLVDSTTAGLLPMGAIPILRVEEVGETRTLPPAAGPLSRLPRMSPDHPAYVIYTSGSTGKPKGVVIPHRAVAARMRLAAVEDLPPGERIIQRAALSFDVSVFELFAPLLTGGRMYLPKPGGEGDPVYLMALACEHGVRRLSMPPALLNIFLEQETLPRSALHLMVTGGEAVPLDLPARFHARMDAALENRYGPTETTISMMIWNCSPGEVLQRLPIGRPIQISQIYLLDALGQPVPPGMPGELSIGGVCLARGYLHRPALTAERFVPNPFADTPGERLYRTGDLVRYRMDGAVEFLGRIDNQVKVRGFRVELGEIEAALLEHPLLRQAAVADRPDPATGSRRLVAWLVPLAGTANAVAEVREHLQRKLPGYMVPADFVVLAALPLLPSGKVDRRALPMPDPSETSRAAFAAPRSPIEGVLAGIWESVLGIERIGVQDHFFDLGGHSLAAVQVAFRVREALGVELPLRDLFMAPVLADLARVIASEPGAAQEEERPLLPTEEVGPAPLSFAQERFWLLDRLAVGRPDYNIALTLELRGELRVQALARALAALVRRHDALRAVFTLAADGPVQRPGLAWVPPLPRIELSGLPPEVAAREARQRAREEAERSFDLAEGRLLRALLLRVEVEKHLFLVTTHHIAFDGSHELFFRELAALYAEPESLPAPPALWFGDFARWERQRLSGPLRERQLAYWRERLGGDTSVLDLPFDRPRPAVRAGRGASSPLVFGEDLRLALLHLARRQGMTLYMVLLAGFQALLHRYTEQIQIRVGSPVALRPHPDLERMVGCFTNTLVLSCELAPELAGGDLLARVRSAALEAFAHRDLPFEVLVRELQPERDLSRTPLFQTMLSLTVPLEAAGLKLPGLAVSFPRTPLDRARFDLLLGIWDWAGLAGQIEYDRDLFDPPTVLRLAGHLHRLLAGLAADPDRRIGDLPFLSEGELHQLAQGWNDTRKEVEGDDRCIHELFALRAALNPEAVAVLSTAEAWTYGELKRRANRLAWRLIELGVGPGVQVGIHLERAPALVAGLLAALKAGAAYVPLETSLPEERLRLIAVAAGVRHVVTQRSLAARVAAWGGDSRQMVLAEEAESGPDDAPARRVSPDHPAYVIFTSGSTGTPKGVRVRHRAVVNLIEWVNRTFDFGPADRVLFLTSPGFDLSVYDLFGLLAVGGSVRVAAEWELGEPQRLLEVLCREPVTFWNSAPAALQRLEPFFAAAETGESRLRLVFLSGDWLPVSLPDAVRQAFPAARVVSLGGATEATVWSNFHPVGIVDPTWASIPYGRPIQNSRYYVLDAALWPCPIGVAGDLYIGGLCLSDGYADAASLTGDAFLPDPFCLGAGGRLYRTGDRARFHSDGNLEFLGRRDQQVKIRGYRIELGEIEVVLRTDPRVREVVVVARRYENGEVRLVAYVVGADTAPLGEHLASLARRRLPESMIPFAFVTLDALPLTANGKVDRKSLPAPVGEEKGAGEAPQTPLAELLALLWAEVLGLERTVGAGEDFFALGGHSLLAARLAARVRETLGIDLPLRDLFTAPTPAALAVGIAELMRDGAPLPPALRREAREEDPPLSFAQERLWVLERMAPGTATYHIPATLRISGSLAGSALASGLGEIRRRHEVLRTRFVLSDEQPVQVIDPPGEFLLPLVDLSACPEEMREEEMTRLAAAAARFPFDLERGPLFRAVLLRLAAVDHVLAVTLHHGICDGPSVAVMIRELGALYHAFRAGLASPLAAPVLQYADFALWQRRRLPEVEAAQLAYWRGQLAGAPPLLELPYDRPRPPVESFRGASLSLVLPAAVAAGVATLAARTGSTRFMAWLGLFQILLARTSRQADLVVGFPFANRDRVEIADLIGLFVNTLVVRSHVLGSQSVRDLLGRVRDTCLGAYSHADLPFERLLEELRPERNLSHHPLFQVLFALGDDSAELLRDLPGLDLSLLPSPLPAARLDLALNLAAGAAGAAVVATCEYRTELFDRATIGRMLEHLAILAEGAAEDPDRPLGSLPLLSPAESRQLAIWSVAPAEVPARGLVHRLFASRAAATPDALAVAADDGALSYGELERRANRLARRLRRLGVKPEARIGVCVDRCAAAVVALLAVFKAGGAYVPLDRGYPAERLAFLIEDAGVSWVVTESRDVPSLPIPAAATLLLDADAAAIGAEEAGELAEAAGADTLAYLIYTSGSTGRPKGVAVEHGSLAAVLVGVLRELGFGASDSIPAVAALSFDISLLEVLLPLLAGGTCRLLSERPLDLQRVLAAMAAASFFHAVPALMRQVVEAVREEAAGGFRFRSLRTLLVGGDRVPPDLVEDLRSTFPAAEVRILYGPTETTIVCASCPVNDAMPGGRALLGRPLPGAELRLLDEGLEPVPQGVVGEICVGGVGVGRGYWQGDELTRERFLTRDRGRFYRTGDLARFLSDGTLEFLGRTDQQVKIRGFRIDPGEVEVVLRDHPAVGEAVVVAAEDGSGDRRLVAYVVPSVREPALSQLLRAHLAERLPEFMVPSLFVPLDSLPLTAHGKLDRKALPAVGGERPETATAYVAPATPLERELTAILAEVLGVSQLGVHDDFFQLGGHSLLATRALARIRKRLAIEVPLRLLFEMPTVARLAGVLATRTAGEGLSAPPPLAPAFRAGPTPLSYAQERLWFLDRLDPGSAVYNVSGLFRLEGELPVAALERGLGALVRRHEALRTRFAEIDGEPVQWVEAPQPWRLAVIDLAGLPAPARKAEFRAVATAEAWRPFDLAAGTLLRTVLLATEVRERSLLVATHHIVADAGSMSILVRDLALMLRPLNGEPALAPLPVQYTDYAAWQRSWLTGAALEGRLSYWRRQLAGNPPTLDLPFDRPRPTMQTFRGALERVALSEPLTAVLRELAHSEAATPFHVLLALFETLLFRLTGQTDFLLGSPVSGRTLVETEDLVGLFVNTLVLRADLGGEPAFREVLARARQVALAAQAHQDMPLEKLIAELQPQRDLSHSPLFQVFFSLQSAPRCVELPGARLEPVPFAAPTAKFDLSLLLSDAEGTVAGGLEYNTDLFEAVTIRRMAGYLGNLLAAVLASPQDPVAALPLASRAETHQILLEWSGQTSNPSSEASPTVHELFATQARRTPEAVALVEGARRITYLELASRAGLLARRLRLAGVGPETRVGVCARRTAELVAALLAVLEAGGAYVPLDPAYPAERLRFILEDSAAQVLLIQAELRELLPAVDTKVLLLDRAAFAPGAPAVSFPTVLPGNLAYLIYTSGSTGRPKAVAIEHGNAAAFLRWAGEAFAAADLAGVLAATSIAFDLSVFELFTPLTRGGTVILAEDALALPGLLAASAVTLVNTVPSAAAELVSAGGSMRDVRRINLAGEPLRRDLVTALYAASGGCEVRNLYGPSEATTYSTCAVVASDARRPPSIGRPVTGTRAYVLDAGLRAVPLGVIGELYLGGAGLARGYLGRPERTAERFIPDPFGAPGERLYRTGDLARHRTDGELDFLGRSDHQVKIRGFRIETGEIEAALVRHPGVREAVVVAVEQRAGGLGLIAYAVPAGDAVPEAGELRAFLGRALPSHMIPAEFVALPALPRTPTGKVDRRALPAPERPRLAADAEDPLRTPIEEIVSDVWAEVLGLPEVRNGEDFFALGGHSLLAIRVISRLQERLGVELSLRSVFRHPTVAALAIEIERQLAAWSGRRPPPVERTPRDGAPLPLSFAQERLWFFDLLEPGSPIYNVNGVFALRGTFNAAALAAGLSAVVQRHESLRTRFVDQGQVVLPAWTPLVPRIDLRFLPAAVREAEAHRLTAAEARRSFDLAHGPLLRAVLAVVEEERHLLSVTLHHIACDGWSLGVLLREVKVLYAAFAMGERPDLPELAVQYADFARWQRDWLQGEVLEEQLAYWRRQLDDAPSMLALPFDHPRPPRPSHRGGLHRFTVAPGLTAGLRALGRADGVTLFMILSAAWAILLQRYSGQQDVVVGTNIANRHRRSLEGLIGLLANTVALRFDLTGDPTVRVLLSRVRETVLGAHAHQDLPFEKLVEALRPERGSAYHPIFQVMLVLQEPLARRSSPAGLDFVPVEIDHGSAKFDLTLFAVEENGGITAVLEYAADLFEAATIADLAGQLTQLLAVLPAWADEPISALRLGTLSEEELVLGTFTENLEI